MNASRRRPSRWLERSLALALAGLAAVASLAAAEEAAPPAPNPPAPAPAPGETPTPAPAPIPPEGPPGPNSPRGSPERQAWRESTWPAPTAEDWKKPVLLTWQRTWEDAVAVSKETGRPILVCINMDGEIASEHYAGVRYRSPEVAALYEPYVTVIASVYRHSPRDHDDDGKRIPCPRFGGVTCGEHISIEPVIFEKFCDGQRVAPRHIMVELDGSETYDVFYRNDVVSVLEDVRQGIAKRKATPPPAPVRSDRPMVERVASRDVTDRTAVEAAYAQGDPATRRALLEAAVKNGDKSPLDLLRLAVFGLDPEASRLAREALAKVEDPAATGLVADALRVPMDAAEREALIGTLERLGGSSALAKWLAVVHKGLAKRSTAVDPAAWKSNGGATYQGPDLGGESLVASVETRARASKTEPTDPATRLALAEGYLFLAMEADSTFADAPRKARLYRRHLLQEARRAAEEAERLGAKGWRLDATLALAAYYAGDVDAGYARAATAVKALPPGDTGWTSMAVLTVFAEGRWKAIKKAVKEKLDFPPEWLADVNAAYAVLLKHPLGTDDQVAWHYDLLDWLGAADSSVAVLRAGMARFPDSARLHGLLRDRVLKNRGPAGLEAAYEKMLAEPGAAPRLVWFSGLASVAAAEQHRRALALRTAQEAYARAIALYEKGAAAEPAHKDAADHGVALAHAALARIAYEMGDDARALDETLASLSRRPASAGTRDGMGITPGETAQMLLARLRTSKKDDAVARLEAALAAVDPELLRPDRE